MGARARLKRALRTKGRRASVRKADLDLVLITLAADPWLALGAAVIAAVGGYMAAGR